MFNRPLPLVVRHLGHFPGGRLPGKRRRALRAIYPESEDRLILLYSLPCHAQGSTLRSAPMSEIIKIHDTFFRETMSHKEVAADFLANYLPAKEQLR
jgi:hypothetical protein